MVRILLLFTLAVATAAQCAQAAGNFNAGVAAYKSADFSAARQIFAALAEKGDARAEFAMGLLYDHGEGVTPDDAEALKWYRRAARNGNADAVFKYREVAEAGDIQAQADIGALYLIGKGVPKDYEKAQEWLQKAATESHPDACYNLAYIYDAGLLGNRNVANAILWYERAAAYGHVKAKFNLALLYRAGKGVARNEAMAVTLLEDAAGQGIAEAAFAVAVLREKIAGLDADPEAIRGWYEQAALAGNIAAQNNLAFFYTQGLGVQPDQVTAYAWYYLAAEAGLIEAVENRALIERRLSSEQITNAEALAREFENRIKDGNTLSQVTQ